MQRPAQRNAGPLKRLKNKGFRCKAILCATICVLLVATLVGAFVPKDEVQDLFFNRPNIILIHADDLREVEHLKIPPEYVATPHLDELKRRGVTFTNTHACAVDCRASRTCMLLSAYPPRTGIWNNWEGVKGDIASFDSMFAMLKRAGYYVATLQKIAHRQMFLSDVDSFSWRIPGRGAFVNTVKDSHGGTNEHWGTIDGPLEDTGDGQAVEKALQFIDKAATMYKPMFLGVGLDACHYPQDIPKEMMARVPQKPGMPPTPENDLDDVPATAQGLSPKSHERAKKLLGTAEGTDFVRHYYGCVAMIDELLGRLMHAVDRSPEEWFVMFTADHGFHLLDKERMSKYTMWPSSTHVPLVLMGGQFTGGKRFDMPVTLADVFPTLAALVKEEILHKPSGMDLGKLVQPGGDNLRDNVQVYYKAKATGKTKSVVTKDWFYIRYSDQSVELYDWRNDPWALNNVRDEHPQVVDTLWHKGLTLNGGGQAGGE